MQSEIHASNVINKLLRTINTKPETVTCLVVISGGARNLSRGARLKVKNRSKKINQY